MTLLQVNGLTFAKVIIYYEWCFLWLNYYHYLIFNGYKNAENFALWAEMITFAFKLFLDIKCTEQTHVENCA